MRLKRFTWVDRLFHLGLMLTFMIQAATGFSRIFVNTRWGRTLNNLFGGYDASQAVHRTVGVIMVIGFVLHIFYQLWRLDWRRLGTSLLGPDSLIPTWQDFLHLGQRIRWFFGLGPGPRFDRWTYWEKFDYWAVFWGLPLLAITGFMLMYPLQTCRVVPGWTLNVAALLHRAEAILAVGYIFIVHFFIGHFRPSSFPMNEAMFTGSVDLEDAKKEKPAWVARLESQGRLPALAAPPAPPWFRALSFVFGYAVIAFGVFILINGIRYSAVIRW